MSCGWKTQNSPEIVNNKYTFKKVLYTLFHIFLTLYSNWGWNLFCQGSSIFIFVNNNLTSFDILMPFHHPIHQDRIVNQLVNIILRNWFEVYIWLKSFKPFSLNSLTYFSSILTYFCYNFCVFLKLNHQTHKLSISNLTHCWLLKKNTNTGHMT